MNHMRHIVALGIILLLSGCIAQEIEYYAFPTYYSGCELHLVEEFIQAAALEPDIPEEDILAVINKWHHELSQSPDLHLLPPLMVAFLIDPVTYDIYEELHIDPLTPEVSVEKLAVWAHEHMVHTQTLPVFARSPGNDPWGTIPVSATRRTPVYKYVLPSEMSAMSMFSGKITGKCSSLAALNASLLRLMGAEPDNVIILWLEGHTLGLVKIDDTLYEFNNTVIHEVDNLLFRKRFTARTFLGLFNEYTSTDRDITINDDVLDSQDSLVDALWRITWESEPPHDMLLPEKIQRDEVVSLIFGESNATNELAILAKYTYQSLYVKRPELYLKASLRSPKALELSAEFDSADEIVEWIKTHIATGSIFKDHEHRIMLADQVIVFKTGGFKDQAVLAHTLLTLKGYNPIIMITSDTAYIEVDTTIYDIKTWNIVDSVTGTVELVLQL